MYLEAELVFRSYIPEKLEIGMLFTSSLERGKHSYPIVYSLSYIPHDEEEYVKLNGYPVKPYLVDSGDPNLAFGLKVIATPQQIGWLDEGDHTDELRDIEIKDMNIILKDYDGWVDVEAEERLDKYGNVSYGPVIYAEKVTMRFYQEEEEDDEPDDFEPSDMDDESDSYAEQKDDFL
jgi:hypothetical protein